MVMLFSVRGFRSSHRKMKGARGRVHRSRKTSKLAPKDYISTMPEEIITNILHRLPLHDIMKTSILSKDWRYKYTMITQLVFDKKFFKYLKKKKYEDYEGIINQLLRLLTGAITKFVLDIDTFKVDFKQINDWIIYLSEKGIKEFAFKYGNRAEPELTPHLFSCLELTHLELHHCALRLPSEFRGFPRLLRLFLSDVTFKDYKGWEFLTRSPLVESLKLVCQGNNTLKHVEIAKLKNLKTLLLYVLSVGNIFQLAGSLPKVQELTLDFFGYKILADTNRVPVFLPCLKALDLYNVDFRDGDDISCAIELICGSPNLETLSIQSVGRWDPQAVHEDDDSSAEVDFRRMAQLQLLRKVKLAGIRGLDSEICLIKYILECSPLLKKMDIYADPSEAGDLKGRRLFERKLRNYMKGRRKIERRLSKFLNRHVHRLPSVEIDIFWRYRTVSFATLPMQHNQLLSAD